MTHRNHRNAASRPSIYQTVTERIISSLKAGVIPWEKPWKTPHFAGGPFPRNFYTGKPYRGINVLLLWSSEYNSPFWLTFKQAQALKGSVRKGEHGTQIIFYKQLPEHAKKDEEATGEDERVPFVLCHYTVFNVEQCDGLALPEISQPAIAPEIDEDEVCESIVTGWENRPALHLNRPTEAQGIEQMPTRHMGPAVVGMMRRKAWADRAATAAEVQAANAELETIQTQSATARQQLDALLNSPDQRQELAKDVLGKIGRLATREEGAKWIDERTADLEKQKRRILVQEEKYRSGRAWFEAQPVPGGGVGYSIPTYGGQLKLLTENIRQEQARAVRAEKQIAGHRYTKSWFYRLLYERDPRLDQWGAEAVEARKSEHSLVRQKDAIEAQWIGHEKGWERAARLNREENEARIGELDLQIDDLRLARETVLRKLARRDADPQIRAERQARQERKRQRSRQRSRGGFERER